MENISPLLDDGMDGEEEVMGRGIYYTGLHVLLCFRGILNNWLSVCIFPWFKIYWKMIRKVIGNFIWIEIMEFLEKKRYKNVFGWRSHFEDVVIFGLNANTAR